MPTSAHRLKLAFRVILIAFLFAASAFTLQARQQQISTHETSRQALQPPPLQDQVQAPASSADADPPAAESATPPSAAAPPVFGATGSSSDATPATDPIPDGGPTAAADSTSAAESTSASPPDLQDQGQPAPGQVGPVVNHQIVDRHFFSDFLTDFLHDERHIWTGPFEPHNYDSHTMLHFGVPFIIISGVLIGTDNTTAKWLPGTRSGLDKFGTGFSYALAPYSVAAYSGLWYLVGRATHNEHTRETGFLALEAIGDSQIIAGVLKVATWRARPAGPDTRLAGFWRGGFSSARGGLSMPSGHTIAAFAMATVFAREYRYHIAVPIIAYSLASLVGFARLSAHEHWYSDAFVGASLGFLTGRYVYINHHDTDLPGSVPTRHTPRASKLRPSLEAGPQGFGLYWHF